MAGSKPKKRKPPHSSASASREAPTVDTTTSQSHSNKLRAVTGALILAFAVAAVGVWGTGVGQKLSEAVTRRGDVVKVATQVLPQDADMHVFKDALALTKAQLSALNALNHASDAYDAWFSSRHSVAADGLVIRVVLTGNRDHEIRVTNLKPLATCSAPLTGTLFDSPPAGGEPNIDFRFNLDKTTPKVSYVTAEGVEKSDYFGDNTVSLKDGEQVAFTISMYTAKHYCRVKLNFEILDETEIVDQEVSNQGLPFEVSAVPSVDGFSQYKQYQVAYVGGVLASKTAPINAFHEAGWTRVRP